MTLRTAEAEDHRWIVAAHGEVYAAEFGFDQSFQDGIAAKMRALLGRVGPFDRIWIGWIGGERAGSIAISDRGGGVAFLNFVLVLPGFRGRGAGAALMAHALEHAQGQGFGTVRLETYDRLADARVLYRRLGFRLVESEPGRAAYGRCFAREFWELPLRNGDAACRR